MNSPRIVPDGGGRRPKLLEIATSARNKISNALKGAKEWLRDFMDEKIEVAQDTRASIMDNLTGKKEALLKAQKTWKIEQMIRRMTPVQIDPMGDGNYVYGRVKFYNEKIDHVVFDFPDDESSEWAEGSVSLDQFLAWQNGALKQREKQVEQVMDWRKNSTAIKIQFPGTDHYLSGYVEEYDPDSNQVLVEVANPHDGGRTAEKWVNLEKLMQWQTENETQLQKSIQRVGPNVERVKEMIETAALVEVSDKPGEYPKGYVESYSVMNNEVVLAWKEGSEMRYRGEDLNEFMRWQKPEAGENLDDYLETRSTTKKIQDRFLDGKEIAKVKSLIENGEMVQVYVPEEGIYVDGHATEYDDSNQKVKVQWLKAGESESKWLALGDFFAQQGRNPDQATMMQGIAKAQEGRIQSRVEEKLAPKKSILSKMKEVVSRDENEKIIEQIIKNKTALAIPRRIEQDLLSRISPAAQGKVDGEDNGFIDDAVAKSYDPQTKKILVQWRFGEGPLDTRAQWFDLSQLIQWKNEANTAIKASEAEIVPLVTPTTPESTTIEAEAA